MSKISRRFFIKHAGITAGTLYTSGVLAMSANRPALEKMTFRLLRHASLIIEINHKKILLDPMLSKKETMDPIGNAANNFRNPMVDLPMTEEEIQNMLSAVDAVFITHTHRDHWDLAAEQMIDKQKPVFCQPADIEKIRKQGFINVTAVNEVVEWSGITIHRTAGQHGTGNIGKSMGTVSGFVFSHNQQTLYVAGDTVWCTDVQEAIARHHPDHIIVNGGGARFLTGDPITMTIDDVLTLATHTSSRITVVHLNSINHCLQKRNDFNSSIQLNHLDKRILVPADGDWINV